MRPADRHKAGFCRVDKRLHRGLILMALPLKFRIRSEIRTVLHARLQIVAPGSEVLQHEERVSRRRGVKKHVVVLADAVVLDLVGKNPDAVAAVLRFEVEVPL